MKKRILFLCIAFFSVVGAASAQEVGLKTNLVSDGFLSPNLGFHALGGEYNFGNIKNSVKFLGSDFSNKQTNTNF